MSSRPTPPDRSVIQTLCCFSWVCSLSRDRVLSSLLFTFCLFCLFCLPSWPSPPAVFFPSLFKLVNVLSLLHPLLPQSPSSSLLLCWHLHKNNLSQSCLKFNSGHPALVVGGLLVAAEVGTAREVDDPTSQPKQTRKICLSHRMKMKEK